MTPDFMEYLDRFETKFPKLEILSLRKLHSPIRLRCRIHDTEFYARSLHYLIEYGAGCPLCKVNDPLINEEFAMLLFRHNPTVEPLSSYKGLNEPVLMTCHDCGTVEKRLAKDILMDSRCICQKAKTPQGKSLHPRKKLYDWRKKVWCVDDPYDELNGGGDDNSSTT